VANASRNARAEVGRRRRWAPARDALWDFLAPHLDDGATVAIVGAGNGDDLPLRRIARRADAVTLIDIDPGATRGAQHRLGRAQRRKVTVIGHDVTSGGADAVARAALDDPAPATDTADLPHLTYGLGGEGRPCPTPPGDISTGAPLPGAPYDLVVGDLFYSQLLYPALLDLGVEENRRASVLGDHAPALTRAVVRRLHASAPRVVHLHDPLAWWDGHGQPVELEAILTLAATDGPDAALVLAARGDGPHESDPRSALRDLGLHLSATALWRWPFSAGVDYLTCATLVDARPRLRRAAPPAR
jgi:hypothetical protein